MPASRTLPVVALLLAAGAAVAQPKTGKVQPDKIALGQSLWWNWISAEWAKGADNAKLLRWLLVPKGGA